MSNVWIPPQHRADQNSGMSGGAAVIEMPGQSVDVNEMLLVKRTFAALEKAYPGHSWSVMVKQGIMDIQLCSAFTGNMGYTIKHMQSYSASDLDRQIVKAGGELLERYRQRRGRLDDASLYSQRRDAAGRLTPER
jgi:hypothetical protein